MPERLECEVHVLQKARYINTLTFTFTFVSLASLGVKNEPCLKKFEWKRDQRVITSHVYVTCI